MSADGEIIADVIEALDELLAQLPAGAALTALDTLVALVICRDGLLTDQVIKLHSENIPKFVDFFRSEKVLHS